MRSRLLSTIVGAVIGVALPTVAAAQVTAARPSEPIQPLPLTIALDPARPTWRGIFES